MSKLCRLFPMSLFQFEFVMLFVLLANRHPKCLVCDVVSAVMRGEPQAVFKIVLAGLFIYLVSRNLFSRFILCQNLFFSPILNRIFIVVECRDFVIKFRTPERICRFLVRLGIMHHFQKIPHPFHSVAAVVVFREDFISFYAAGVSRILTCNFILEIVEVGHYRIMHIIRILRVYDFRTFYTCEFHDHCFCRVCNHHVVVP